MSHTLDNSEKETEAQEAVIDAERYLVFRIGDAYYGTPLLGVREVAEPPQVKPVPGTQSRLSGVVNLRGQIVPVVDLELHLGGAPIGDEARAMMVFETGSGTVATLVRTVESVLSVENSSVRSGVGVRGNIAQAHMIGITNSNKRIVFLIDLNKLLSDAEVRLDTTSAQ